MIADNTLDGVYISDAGTSGNSVANNIIGLGPTGMLAAGNGTNGVWINNAADSNAIGGRVLTEANTIAGNGGAGILINGIGANNISDTRFNLVVGNRIGLNAAGAAAVPNGGSGILVSNGAWGNTLGNPTAELRNTIAGNGGDGVTILSANSTTVAGNLIGRNISDTANIGNAKNGVRLDNGASFNAVQDNVIDGNGAHGVVISGTATTTNTLPANVIGNNFSNGLMLQSGTRGNIIGVISGGLMEVNGGHGIALDGAGTSNNLITGTLSALNPLAGIREHNGAANNVWSHISTFSNGGLGIDKDPYLAPTGPYPTILSVTVVGGSVTVGGKASAAILQSVKVELYRVALDPSGFGEGQTYLGSGNADSGGNWSLTFTGACGCFTALQTTTNASTSLSASSEFGPNSLSDISAARRALRRGAAALKFEPALRVQLLGEFQLAYQGTALTNFHSARLQALLAYLLLHRASPQPRQRIAFQLWPDSSETHARSSLRFLLHQLRRALPDTEHFIAIDEHSIQWRSGAAFTLDVAEFEDAVTRAGQAGPPGGARSALVQAANLYHGELLPDCYDDWIAPERERLHQMFVGSLERLTALLEGERDYGAAIGWAQRLLRCDPLHEETYRRLMRLHAAGGDLVGVLRVYQTCAAVLQRELSVEPSALTHETYARLLRREPEAAGATGSDAPRAPRGEPSAIGPFVPDTPPNNLPIRLTSFVGREREKAEVARRAASALADPDRRRRLRQDATGAGGCDELASGAGVCRWHLVGGTGRVERARPGGPGRGLGAGRGRAAGPQPA